MVSMNAYEKFWTMLICRLQIKRERIGSHISLNTFMIQEEYIGHTGVKYIFEYTECDTFDILPPEKCTQVYSVLFVEGKMVIVKNGKVGTWGLPGGTIESCESFEDTLIRETIEEANIQIDWFQPVGYQKVTDTRDDSYVYQLRYVSRGTVIGEFETDPAGTIVEVAHINAVDYKRYFDWGKIGESIIARAVSINDMI